MAKERNKDSAVPDKTGADQAPAAQEQPKEQAPDSRPQAPAAQNADGEQPKTEPRRQRAKTSRSVSAGIAHIRSTFNNTSVTITDSKGAVLAWSSAGRMGFKGARKSTAYAATIVAQDAARQAGVFKLQDVEVRVQGPGAGRESAVRALQAAGLNISVIRDITPIPHNGCRPRKRRRV